MAGLLNLVETAMRLLAVAGGAERTQRAVDSLQITVIDYVMAGVRGFFAVVQVLVLGLALLLSAAFFYALLYAAVMPSKLHSQPLHLDYTAPDGKGPSTTVNFLAPQTQWRFSETCLPPPSVQVTAQAAETPPASLLNPFGWGSGEPPRKRLLKLRQKYSIAVELELPESPANERLGVFMVEVELLDEYDKVIATSRRPASLRYESGLVNTLRTLLLAPLLLGGVASQSQRVAVEMFDHFQEQRHMPFTRARVRLSTAEVRIYRASLGITAQLLGLRYYMFHWFYTTALACILCIAAVEAAALSALFLANSEASLEDGEEAGFGDARPTHVEEVTVTSTTRIVSESKEPAPAMPRTPASTAFPAAPPATPNNMSGNTAGALASREVPGATPRTFRQHATHIAGEIIKAKVSESMRRSSAPSSSADPPPPMDAKESDRAVVHELKADAHLDIRAPSPQPSLLKSGAQPYRVGPNGVGNDVSASGPGLLKGRRRMDEFQ